MYIYKPESNVNYDRRNKTKGRREPGRRRPMPTSSEIEADKVKIRLRATELGVGTILSAKRLLELKKHMPAIRKARQEPDPKKKARILRHVPKRILAQVENLKLE